MKKIYENEKHGEERAYYGAKDSLFIAPVFDGEEDGESALKECSEIEVRNGVFNLRYPLWHCEEVLLDTCVLSETCRAPIWYTTDLNAHNLTVKGVKCLRECSDVVIRNSDIDSEEFGWKCSDVLLADVKLNSVYAFFASSDVRINNLTFTGKYSFQYVENAEISNSVLNTKDAFWHSKNVTVKDSVIEGEYLGWYSEGLTLINCTIKGTQPLCYCRKLNLVNCKMIDTDLSFEYSDVNADIDGSVLSVKNPLSGTIKASSYGQVILEGSVKKLSAKILTKQA